ncbi:hypothetical protein A2914_02975 [Candidatus Nomurabacteria bacterium RIFCSPLOWO2_01_FULL_41_21]|uniref:HTH arsR-type domain-containing protein n=2 Tax=Candidatus Nomuraibacteriota TaxID=1752729 RepID=A0A1F6V430_9BACT|nr:MAG: hypothetical protein A2733_01870 [Candidatus Nomurabacteria bacterium RIFCSPHIGHO2_01_FULL_40_20]OGI88107.1 MAG: hypothetical protein A2914_02975 [Candidatus Nomurabacteria bacterium RIFCSPLOWO2_01_FULL_41_21]
MKKPRELERITKGFANHRRIEILELLNKTPELSLSEISDKFKSNLKTTGEHVRKLAIASLVWKRYEGNIVHHKLSPRGKSILKFLRILE